MIDGNTTARERYELDEYKAEQMYHRLDPEARANVLERVTTKHREDIAELLADRLFAEVVNTESKIGDAIVGGGEESGKAMQKIMTEVIDGMVEQRLQSEIDKLARAEA